MYGMMPRAKIVMRRKLPPLNRSKIPRTNRRPVERAVQDGAQLMPGVGICAPMRYTAKQRQREENTVPQIRDAEHVSERFEEFVHVLLSVPCLLLLLLTSYIGRCSPAYKTLI